MPIYSDARSYYGNKVKGTLPMISYLGQKMGQPSFNNAFDARNGISPTIYYGYENMRQRDLDRRMALIRTVENRKQQMLDMPGPQTNTRTLLPDRPSQTNTRTLLPSYWRA